MVLEGNSIVFRVGEDDRAEYSVSGYDIPHKL